MQLYSPLNQLGSLYRSINQSLVDTEKLLALLNEPTEINDKPNAPDLIVHDGEIEFGSFSHLPRNIQCINSLNFQKMSISLMITGHRHLMEYLSKFLKGLRLHL